MTSEIQNMQRSFVMWTQMDGLPYQYVRFHRLSLERIT